MAAHYIVEARRQQVVSRLEATVRALAENAGVEMPHVAAVPAKMRGLATLEVIADAADRILAASAAPKKRKQSA